MDNIKKYRLLTIVLFIALIIILLLLSVNIWNSSLKGEYIYNYGLIIICIILILIIGTVKFIISYKLSDKNKIDNNIKIIVEKEKAKIIAEFEKQEIQEEKLNETEENINEIIKRIIPDSQNLKTLKSYTIKLLINISKEIEIVHGLFFAKTKNSKLFTLTGEYAFTGEKKPKDFKSGETLPGQAAKNKDIMIINDIPENYFNAESGLGKSIPKSLILVPIINKNTSVAVMELATFKVINKTEQKVLEELSNKLGDKIDKFVN